MHFFSLSLSLSLSKPLCHCRCHSRYTGLVHSFNQIQAIIDSSSSFICSWMKILYHEYGLLCVYVIWLVALFCTRMLSSTLSSPCLLEIGFCGSQTEAKQCECYAQLIYGWTMNLLKVNFRDFGFRLSVFGVARHWTGKNLYVFSVKWERVSERVENCDPLRTRKCHCKMLKWWKITSHPPELCRRWFLHLVNHIWKPQSNIIMAHTKTGSGLGDSRYG